MIYIGIYTLYTSYLLLKEMNHIPKLFPEVIDALVLKNLVILLYLETFEDVIIFSPHFSNPGMKGVYISHKWEHGEVKA